MRLKIETMIRHIFNITTKGCDHKKVNRTTGKAWAWWFDHILGERWLNWFGHVEHSRDAFSQHVIYMLIEGAVQGNPRWHGSNRQRMTVMSGSSMRNSRSSRKEHLEIRCEIFYSCSSPATWQKWPKCALEVFMLIIFANSWLSYVWST